MTLTNETILLVNVVLTFSVFIRTKSSLAKALSEIRPLVFVVQLPEYAAHPFRLIGTPTAAYNVLRVEALFPLAKYTFMVSLIFLEKKTSSPAFSELLQSIIITAVFLRYVAEFKESKTALEGHLPPESVNGFICQADRCRSRGLFQTR